MTTFCEGWKAELDKSGMRNVPKFRDPYAGALKSFQELGEAADKELGQAMKSLDSFFRELNNVLRRKGQLTAHWDSVNQSKTRLESEIDSASKQKLIGSKEADQLRKSLDAIHKNVTSFNGFVAMGMRKYGQDLKKKVDSNVKKLK